MQRHARYKCPPLHSLIADCELNPVPPLDSPTYLSCLSLSEEARELYLHSDVTHVQELPDPLTMARDWVATNQPLLIKGAVRHWPAVNKWTLQYLRDKVGEKVVSVSVTPTGYADAPNEGYFVLPEERSMSFKDFLSVMKDPTSQHGVFYVQKQNDNLTSEFEELMDDLDPGGGREFKWFTDVIGRSPDAVNFWIGDSRAVTSMHKDHYENIYCVISGYKDFILIPPTDTTWVPHRVYPQASYKWKGSVEPSLCPCCPTTTDLSESNAGSCEGHLQKLDLNNQVEKHQADCNTLASSNRGCTCFSIVPEEPPSTVPWISIDPVSPDLKCYPYYSNARPVRVRVHAGDALYLPSLWFHHVRQSHGCIAVNYWHDMDYGIKYNYYQTINSLTWKTPGQLKRLIY